MSEKILFIVANHYIAKLYNSVLDPEKARAYAFPESRIGRRFDRMVVVGLGSGLYAHERKPFPEVSPELFEEWLSIQQHAVPWEKDADGKATRPKVSYW